MPIAINVTVIHRLQEQKSVYTADCDRFLSFGADKSAKLELWIEPKRELNLEFPNSTRTETDNPQSNQLSRFTIFQTEL